MLDLYTTVDRQFTGCCNTAEIALKSSYGPPPRSEENEYGTASPEGLARVRSTYEKRANRVGVAGNSGQPRERQKDARDLGGAPTRRDRDVLWTVSDLRLAHSEEGRSNGLRPRSAIGCGSIVILLVTVARPADYAPRSRRWRQHLHAVVEERRHRSAVFVDGRLDDPIVERP